ncbi:MAG: SEC-C metal-binding domain-containing protein [Candidatus Brocadia sp.]|nr:SEC-C metal-binding domain-containing protein [Candidatus Brocadia sp.]
MDTYAEFNVEKMSDKEIIDTFNNMGIHIDLDEFKDIAIQERSPAKLASIWLEQTFYFFYEAICELWKRHLGHMENPEILHDLVDEIVDTYDAHKEKMDRTMLLDIYGKIKKLYYDFLKKDGSPNITLYRKVYEISYCDIGEFLSDIIFDFPSYGLVDEAITIARWFAPLARHPEVFLKDVGYILAEAGRKEEAVQQVKENIQKYPDKLWVVINAGDAMKVLGEWKAAEGYYLKAYGMSANKNDKLDAIQRLIDLYREMGMEENARKYEDEYAELTEPSNKPILEDDKIGRNAPCSCGSGKKYKKCCMNKSL